MNNHSLTTEGLLESKHKVLELWISTSCSLVVAESAPSKANHFLVASRQKSNAVNHLSNEASSVSSSREAKDVYFIPRLVKTHQETVACHNMIDEGRSEGLVVGFEDVIFELCEDVPTG